MEWLRASELQGIAALIAIGQVVFAVVKSLQSPGGATVNAAQSTSPPPATSSSSRILTVFGAVLFLTLGWIVYSIPWAIVAFALRFPPSIVISLPFFICGAFTALGVLLTKAPVVGGFLGGGLPFGTLALYYVSTNSQMEAMAPALGWFTVFGVFSGLLGAITGQTIVQVMRLLKLPIPFY